jgi:hypothetical protein
MWIIRFVVLCSFLSLAKAQAQSDGFVDSIKRVKEAVIPVALLGLMKVVAASPLSKLWGLASLLIMKAASLLLLM